MLTRSHWVFGMVPTVLNLFRKYFSKLDHPSIVPYLNEVNYVRALLDKILWNTLHSTSSSLVTKSHDRLIYLHMCSNGLKCPLYSTNWGSLSEVFGATSWIHLVKGPKFIKRDLFTIEVRWVGFGDLSILTPLYASLSL